MREWIARLRDWTRRDALDRELAEELRFHREQLERDARAAALVTRRGPGRHRCLTLTHPGRTAVAVWIRHPADPGRALAGGPAS